MFGEIALDPRPMMGHCLKSIMAKGSKEKRTTKHELVQAVYNKLGGFSRKEAGDLVVLGSAAEGKLRYKWEGLEVQVTPRIS